MPTDNKPRMKKPTEPGWYWYITKIGFKCAVEVEYNSFFDELIGTLYRDDHMIHTLHVGYSDGWWGPKIEEWKTEIDGSDN